METQSRAYTTALKVDDHFLTSLTRIIASQVEIGRRTVADNNRLSLEQLLAIESGDDESWEANYKRPGLMREISEQTSPHFTIFFSDGYSRQTSMLDEVRAAFEDRASAPDRFRFEMGRYSGPRVTLTIGDFGDAAKFEVRGERPVVVDLDERLRNLCEKAQVGHPMLHRPKFRIALEVGITLLLSLAFQALILAHGGNAMSLPVYLSVVMSVSIFFLWLTGRMGDRWKLMFPLVEFSFGRSDVKRNAMRQLVLLVATSFAFPIALQLIFHSVGI